MSTENNYISKIGYHAHEGHHGGANWLFQTEPHYFEGRCTVAFARQMDESIGPTVEAVEDVGDAKETTAITELLPIGHASLLLGFLGTEQLVHEPQEAKERHKESSHGHTANMESSIAMDRLSKGALPEVVPAGGSPADNEVVGFDQEAHHPEQMEDVDRDHGLHEVGCAEVLEWPLLIFPHRLPHRVVPQGLDDPQGQISDQD